MYAQNFKTIDNELRKDGGCSTEMDYIEQTSWLLFLKYLEDLESNKEMEAELNGKTYTRILDKKYTWSSWACPKQADGSLDLHMAMTGNDLLEFVEPRDPNKLGLFKYLANFKQTAQSPDTLEYKIGEIFSTIKNKFQSGYVMRTVINAIDGMCFQTSEEQHEMSALYEEKIKNMGNSGRSGGEYYTPRPLIRTMVRLLNPKIGDRIYDGACGSAGFLVEAFNYLKETPNMSVDDMNTLQHDMLFGKELKPLPYVIATMNMILHGVETPNIMHTDTLSENIMAIQDKDRFDMVLANPPFGAATQSTVQQNFPIKTGETAYLFMQHFIKYLKAGGSAGVVIKNTFLSNDDAIPVRRELLDTCNLYAVLDLPAKVFTAGVKTVVLFFKKGEPTKRIWYYQLNLDRNLGKTNPLNEKDLADFVECFNGFKETENSWFINVADLDQNKLDLSAKNPNKIDEAIYRAPSKIISEMEELNNTCATILNKTNSMLSAKELFESELHRLFTENTDGWVEKDFELCIKPITYTNKIQRKNFLDSGKFPIVSQEDALINGYWNEDVDVFKIDQPVVIFGDHTKKIKYVDFDFVLGADGVKILAPITEIMPKYFYYCLQSIRIRDLGYARHYRLLKEKTIKYPDLQAQKEIVERLDALHEQIQELEQIYTKQIADLDELKQAILKKAFNGEL